MGSPFLKHDNKGMERVKFDTFDLQITDLRGMW